MTKIVDTPIKVSKKTYLVIAVVIMALVAVVGVLIIGAMERSSKDLYDYCLVHPNETLKGDIGGTCAEYIRDYEEWMSKARADPNGGGVVVSTAPRTRIGG